jgi:phosphate transport system permease protein
MTIASPKHPWRPTGKTLLPDFLGILLTIFISFGIIKLTPLSGKLGFAVSLVLTSLVVSGAINYFRRDRKAAFNAVTSVLIYITGTFLIVPVISILIEIIVKGAPGLTWTMFLNDMSVTSADAPANEGGLLHAIIGTGYLIFFASVLSVPVGILTALYLTEIKGRFAGIVRFFVQAMSGVPSIVAGLFIYAVWMIQLGNQYSNIAGAASLAILMIPTVARTAEEVLKLIPPDLREAGLALGATQWRTVAMIVIPAARSGLITATILGIARVAGETAPLLLTVGGADAVNLNPFNGNSSALPYYIWKAFAMGTDQSIARAWAGIFVLMALVMTFFTLARVFGNRRGRA